MASVEAELHDVIRDALKDTSAVMNSVNEVYDRVPENPWGVKNAYIAIGVSDGVPDDVDCIPGAEITIQLDVYSRNVGMYRMREIVDAVRKALHKRDLQLPSLSANSLCEMQVTFWRVIDDPEPNTLHGVVQVTAYVEEAEVSD